MIIAGRNRGRIRATSAMFEPAAPVAQSGASPSAPASNIAPVQHPPSTILKVLRNRLLAARSSRKALSPRAVLLGFDTRTVMPLLLLALAVSAFIPLTRFELQTASDQVAVETSATLISAIAAILFFDRFWRHLRLRNLLLAGGLAVIAASNLGAGLLLAGNLVIAGHSAAWIVLGGRLAGWLLIAGSAIVPDRRLQHPSLITRRKLAAGAAGILLLTTLLIAFNAHTTSYGILHSGPLGNPTAMLVVQILLALLTTVAAVAFRREAGHEGSPPARLLALACGFAAASALAACASPAFTPSRVGVADILRLGWLAALFACVCVEWSLDERRAPAHALAHERRRMAADVHDLIMQDLSFALANARTLVEDPAHQDSVTSIVSAGERALAGARDVVSGLAERNSQPIAATVEASVRTAARHTPLTFHSGKHSVSTQPDDPTREALVHIAREAVTNAVKHARPAAIEVALEHDDEWRLVVRDDGRGFDTGGQREGFGLASMRRQAEVLGGTLLVRSGDRGGTTVEASLP